MELKTYATGQEFLDRFRPFMDECFPESCFMIENSPVIRDVTDGYNISITDDEGHILIAQRRHSYNLTLAGDKRFVGELCQYLRKEHIEVTGVIGKEELLQEFIRHCRLHTPREYLQYMEFPRGQSLDTDGVSFAEEGDIVNIVRLEQQFRVECNVLPAHSLKELTERARKSYGRYGVYRKDGRIVAQAMLTRDTGKHFCISGAVTDRMYRGRGYMRKVINFLTTEVWKRNETPYLFVVVDNPISNHLYKSIGYTYGIYFSEYEVML